MTGRPGVINDDLADPKEQELPHARQTVAGLMVASALAVPAVALVW